jgi:NADPH-dependent curcumin reductase CurA
MDSSSNLQIVLAERPKADIIPGQTFKSQTVPVPNAADLKDGEILVQNLYLSLDPAMRGWLNGSFNNADDLIKMGFHSLHELILDKQMRDHTCLQYRSAKS